jgi:hypothetical protein
VLFDTRPREDTRPRPPMDSVTHDRIETATFAVG